MTYPHFGNARLPVYFVFVLGTAQTAVTGADLYYWFAAGFGDIVHLKNHNFSAVDGPAMDAPISLIVQGFYSHWIRTLKKWWLCVVTAIIRVLYLPFRDLFLCLKPLRMELSVPQAIATAWSGINVGDTQIYLRVHN